MQVLKMHDLSQGSQHRYSIRYLICTTKLHCIRVCRPVLDARRGANHAGCPEPRGPRFRHGRGDAAGSTLSSEQTEALASENPSIVHGQTSKDLLGQVRST